MEHIFFDSTGLVEAITSSPGWYALAIVVLLGLAWLASRSARPKFDRQAADNEMAVSLGMSCPNCGARGSDPRGSFENRRCSVCGSKFSLKD